MDRPWDAQLKYWPKLTFVLQMLIGWQNMLSLISIIIHIIHWYIRK